MRNQRQNGGYCFGPNLRKPSTKKKPRSRIMQKSCEQWKRTLEYYRPSVPNRNNNANERGNDNGAKIAHPHNSKTYDSSKMVNVNDQQDKVAVQKIWQIPLEEPSNARVTPQPNDLKRPSSSMWKNGSLRPNNVVVSSQKNTEKSRPSSSSLNNGVVYPWWKIERSRPNSFRPNNNVVPLQRNVERSRPSSLRAGNGVVSPLRNVERSRPSSLRASNGVVSSQRNVKRSRPSSLRPSNGVVSPQKNAEMSRPSSLRPSNGVVSPQRNANTSRSSSLRLSHGVVSPQRNAQKFSPSSLRPKNGLVTLNKNIEKSRPSSPRLYNGIFSPWKNTWKSRPPRFRDGFSSGKLEKIDSIGSKDDSNSTLGVLKKYHPSPVVHNSSNIKQIVSSEVHDQDLWMAEEASNSILDLKGNQIIQDLRCNLGNNSSPKFSENLPSQEMAEASCMGNNVERNGESLDGCVQLHSRNQNTSLAKDGRTDDDKVKNKRKELLLEETMMKEPLPEEESETHEDDDSEEAENCRMKKRRRRYIANEDEDDDDGDQNLAGVEGGTAGLRTRTALLEENRTEVSKPFISDSLKLQHHSSLPIDEPIWSGSLKIDSKEYVSLAAHLSTKYCENVWRLSRSLQPVVEVTKLSRFEAWPKSFEASRPTDDNIALYFLPQEMRRNEDLDHLVKEVMENDMVLRAVVGGAEMLIFASILLPEQHQTFQRKPYLWGVFKRREDNVAIVKEEQDGIGRCAQEEEMGKQHASCCGVGKDGCGVAGLNMDVGLEAPKEAERQGMEQEPTPLVARPNSLYLAEGAARPTSAPKAAEIPANHGQIHSTLGVPSGAVFGFVVRQTQRLEKLIQEMAHEGAVVVAMRGEMIVSGLGQPMAMG